MARKYDAIDIVKLFAKMKKDEWRFFLLRAVEQGNINKLMGYRYGLQAGMADAAKKGMLSDTLTLWILNRLREVELSARKILKMKHPMPGDKIVSKTHKGKRTDYVMNGKEAKKRRDKDFEKFLMESNY